MNAMMKNAAATTRFTFGSNPKNYTCCICHRAFDDHGHNPQPISRNPKDRCCDDCNRKVVLAARFQRHFAGLPMRG